MAKLGNADRPNPPKGEAGECRGSIPQKWRCDSTPSRTKIVRAPKHYSAAYKVSLLRHPPVGNTRSRTKTQAQTPRTNTSRTIDFGKITPGCNLSAIGLRDRIAAKPGGMPEAQSPSRTKIVRAPKHYSAAHRVSLLRHPHGGNTRSRTKSQAQTPRTDTSRAIDFGEIPPGCNLSAIGLSVWDCSEARELIQHC